MKASTITGIGAIDLLAFIVFSGLFAKEPNYVLGIIMLSLGFCFVVLVISVIRRFESDRTNNEL